MQHIIKKHSLIPAMATPLQRDGYRVDVAAVRELVNFLATRGVDGLFVGGTTGEGIILTTEQRKLLHHAAVKAAAGRLPILAHVGANTTRAAFDLAAHAADIGADAIVIITPTFYPLSDAALLAHFKTVAAAAPQTACLIYDIPHMAGNGISPALLTQMMAEIPTFIGLKSSRRDVQKVRALIDTAGSKAMVLAGNERVLLGNLALGAAGAISGLATAVPEPFVALMAAFAAGRLREAQNWQRLINRLLDAMPKDARIGGIKRILEERGVGNGVVLPPAMRHLPPLWPLLKATLVQWGQQ